MHQYSVQKLCKINISYKKKLVSLIVGLLTAAINQNKKEIFGD